FRNQYDSDVTVWSPQGRLYQVEYAMEAVKQGAAVVGIKSRTHVVLAAFKRATDDLAANQKKVLAIDDHIGVGFSGLTADAQVLTKFLRTECLNSKYAYNTPHSVTRLIAALGAKMQICTQVYGRRPFGVGFLVAGFDETGSHLIQTCPSSNYYDCKAMAIGARSQSARTYMERKLEEFEDCDRNKLITHGLTALRECLSDGDLDTKNCSMAVVGKGENFQIYDGDAIASFISFTL
ncbi:uncharacterized protein TRIADDRAFT_33023, partial [Trichoplax adhaerens]